MLFFRKNVGGQWDIVFITMDEAKAIQARLIKDGVMMYTKMKKFVNDNKVDISDSALNTILNKVLPSYESLANDFVEEKIKEHLTKND